MKLSPYSPEEFDALDVLERKEALGSELTEEEALALARGRWDQAGRLITQCAEKNSVPNREEKFFCEDLRCDGTPCAACQYAAGIERVRNGVPDEIRKMLRGAENRV